MPEIQASPEALAKSLDIKLKAAEIADSDIDAISNSLDTPEKIQAIKFIVWVSIELAVQKIKAKEWIISPSEQKILTLYERLFPLEAGLNKQLIATNKPSGKISAVLNGNGGAMNFEQLKKLTPEKIQELFRSVNKGDLIAIAKAIPDAKPEWIDQNTYDLLKSIVSATVINMVQNGMTIENMGDIEFLEKNGNDKIKQSIKKEKEWEWILKDYTWNPKVIIKSNGSEISLDSVINASGKLAKGIDISKINTVDLKAGAEQLKKQLPEWTDKAKMEEMIHNLLDSKNGALRGLWELMKIFGALLGLNFEKKVASGEKLVELDKKARYILMTNMRDGKNGYILDEIYDDKWALKISDKKDSKLQLYLADIAKLKIAEWVPAKDADRKYEISTKLTDAINAYQKSLSITPTWRIDKIWLPLIMAKFDANGDLLGQPDPTPEIATKLEHPLGKRILELEGKDFATIKTLLKSSPIPRNQIIELQKELGFTPNNPDKRRSLDGVMGPGTVKEFLLKYDKGMMEPNKWPQPTSAKK